MYNKKKRKRNQPLSDKATKLIEQAKQKKTRKNIKFKGNLNNLHINKKISSDALKYGKIYFVYRRPIHLFDSEMSKKYLGNKSSFAFGLNFYKLFWVFFIGCIIGVIVETIFGLLVDHRLESRAGVIYGPFNPVYGFGAIGLTLCLYWMRNKKEVFIFVLGSILGGAFEYACSLYQEIFMGTVSWDYTGQIGNINGRTSIFYMAMWGALAVVWIKYIYPLLSKLIEKMPNKIGKVVSWILIIFMVFNCTISAAAVNRMSQRNDGIEPKNAFDEFLDETYPDDFLNKIYHHMTYTSTGEDTQEK